MTAEEILNNNIDSVFNDVPNSIKTDFAKKMKCQNRTTCLNAMREYATEQIKKDRERIAESAQAFLNHNDEPIVSKGSILNQLITLD